MLSRQTRLIFIGWLIFCFFMVWAQTSHAVEVITQSQLMTPGGTCERSGKIKLIFDQQDVILLNQQLPFLDVKYLHIRIALTGSGENDETLVTTLCENIHGTETAQDAGGAVLPYSGELISLYETGVEVSDFQTAGSPDVTAYLHGTSEDAFIEIFITAIKDHENWNDPAIRPWIEIGLAEELSGNPTAMYVTVSDFTQKSTLNILPETIGQIQLDFIGSFQIGHFLAEAALPAAEIEALIALYNATNGDNWILKDNWLDVSGAECTWYGVECEDGHVVKLRLANNNLAGTLPPEISQLTFLKELKLENNKLSGGIPPEISSLYSLEELDFSYNTLSGSIPDSLNNLESLTLLSLYENKLTGTIPSNLGNLARLETLYLGMNDLSGPIPKELGNLSHLMHLHLLQNRLSGSIPPEFGNLNSLKELWLGHNELDGDIPGELGNLSQLESLDLSENKLTGIIPAALGSLGQLKELVLFSNQLNGNLPPEIGNLPNLEYLILGHNQLEGGIPKELGKLSLLKMLTLYDNNLDGNIPVEIGQLTGLEILKLNDNKLEGKIPESLGNLIALKELRLEKNKLGEALPPRLGELGSLEILNLSYNNLTGEVPNELGNLSALKELILHNNHLQGRIPAALGSLSALEKIYLDSNRFTGPVPQEITQLTGLIDEESEFRWNAIHTGDANIRAFLNAKQNGGDWESTQTIAPTHLTSPSASETSVALSWIPIVYTQGENSGYEVYFSKIDEEPFDYYGITPDKLTGAIEVTGLEPQTAYFFYLRTKTTDSYNTIFSEISETISVTTQGETPTPPDIPEEESTALSELYTSTGGDNWTNNSGWLDGETSPCDWYAIQCENGHVVELDLTENNLVGTLPASISKFTHLRKLKIGKNQLTGNILGQIVTLTSLEIVDLSDNQLGGGILSEIGMLTNLTELNLFNCGLSGSIPPELGKLAQLTLLNLGSNELSGSIPETLSQLILLTELQLNNNLLEGTIPDIFSNLTVLKILVLNNNLLTGPLPASLASLSSLEKLNLSTNRLSEEIPSAFGQLTMLILLDLSNNEFTGPVPSELKNLINLENNASDFRNNYLYLDPPDTELNKFLKQKQIGGDWVSSQKYIDTVTVTIPAGLEQKDFSMVSFPVAPSDPSAQAAIGITYNTDNYRIGTYIPEDGGYQEYDQGLTIEPGRAYWFFSRNGNTLEVKGSPVSLYKDFDLSISINANTGYGWNMIASPSKRTFNWNTLIIIAGDENGRKIPITDAEAGNYIQDRRIWCWKNGDYVYYQPGGASEDAGFEYDATLQLEATQGVWIKALKPNLSLRFPANAEEKDNPEATGVEPNSLMASVVGQAMTWAGNAIPEPNAAMADFGDSPPAPISGFTAGAESRTDGGGGGCFIRTAFGR